MTSSGSAGLQQFQYGHQGYDRSDNHGYQQPQQQQYQQQYQQQQYTKSMMQQQQYYNYMQNPNGVRVSTKSFRSGLTPPSLVWPRPNYYVVFSVVFALILKFSTSINLSVWVVSSLNIELSNANHQEFPHHQDYVSPFFNRIYYCNPRYLLSWRSLISAPKRKFTTLMPYLFLSTVLLQAAPLLLGNITLSRRRDATLHFPPTFEILKPTSFFIFLFSNIAPKPFFWKSRPVKLFLSQWHLWPCLESRILIFPSPPSFSMPPSPAFYQKLDPFSQTLSATLTILIHFYSLCVTKMWRNVLSTCSVLCLMWVILWKNLESCTYTDDVPFWIVGGLRFNHSHIGEVNSIKSLTFTLHQPLWSTK